MSDLLAGSTCLRCMSPGLCWAAGHDPTVGVLVARVDAAGAPATPWHLHLAAGVVEARASGAWRATATCKMWLQRASPHDVRCMPAFFGAATSLARLQRPVPWTHSQGGASGQEPHRTSGQAARHGAPPRQASTPGCTTLARVLARPARADRLRSGRRRGPRPAAEGRARVASYRASWEPVTSGQAVPSPACPSRTSAAVPRRGARAQKWALRVRWRCLAAAVRLRCAGRAPLGRH